MTWLALDGVEPSTRLTIEHSTRFRYAKPVPASYNEARLLPSSDDHQHVVASRLDLDPVTWRREYRDYWGTRVVSFEAHTGHTELTVTSSADVVVLAAPAPPQASWGELTDARVQDQFAEQLAHTSLSRPGEELVDLATVVTRDLPPSEAARAVCGLITERLSYTPGSTGVRTPGVQAWAAGAGVCQDFAHLAVGALRSVGIPARYVSGYLHPRPDAAVGETVVGESHAWVEWWAGDWYGWDPTNDKPAGELHVAVGRGRDYGDVSPVKGVVAGGGAGSTLEVEVRVTRLR
jgi:transglutaminase-like putative cysteine protease